MPTELPNRLSYLTSAFAALEKFDPESLGDDNPEAMDVVESAVRSHIKGMSGDEARATIEEDCSALQDWLQQPELAASTGHYVYGALFGMTMFGDFDELVG